MYFSHDPVFDAPLRKIESLTQKSKRNVILGFLWSATFDYWALRNYEPCERKPGQTCKERERGQVHHFGFFGCAAVVHVRTVVVLLSVMTRHDGLVATASTMKTCHQEAACLLLSPITVG